MFLLILSSKKEKKARRSYQLVNYSNHRSDLRVAYPLLLSSLGNQYHRLSLRYSGLHHLPLKAKKYTFYQQRTTHSYQSIIMSFSPLLKEAASWFAIGSALGAFVCATVFVLAATAPGMGGASGLARSVGKSVDAVLFPDSHIQMNTRTNTTTKSSSTQTRLSPSNSSKQIC